MKKLILTLCSAFLFLLNAQAQVADDTLKIMFWNVLNYPNSGASSRLQDFKTVIEYEKPDIFTACEIDNQTGASNILNTAFSYSSNHQLGTYLPNAEDQNIIIFDSTKISEISARNLPVIPGSAIGEANGTPRNTDLYTMYYKDPNLALGSKDTTSITFVVFHLKASEGSSNVKKRNVQLQQLKDSLTAIGLDTHVVVAGDYNIYRSSETGWNTISSVSPRLYDPINRVGSWHDGNSFTDVHTQSPRTTQFDGGANGGLDDRFDFILPTGDIVSQGTNANKGRFKYISGSYRAVGNALTDPTNNTQSPSNVVQAIHDGSDHLPVVMEVEVFLPSFMPTSLLETVNFKDYVKAYVAHGKLNLRSRVILDNAHIRLIDISGKIIYTNKMDFDGDTEYHLDLPPLSSGIYTLSIISDAGAMVQQLPVINK